MADPVPCKLCQQTPVVHSHRAGTPWGAVECVSDAHPMVVVKTHRCGSAEEAVTIWNAANG